MRLYKPRNVLLHNVAAFFLSSLQFHVFLHYNICRGSFSSLLLLLLFISLLIYCLSFSFVLIFLFLLPMLFFFLFWCRRCIGNHCHLLALGDCNIVGSCFWFAISLLLSWLVVHVWVVGLGLSRSYSHPCSCFCLAKTYCFYLYIY